MSWQCPRCHEWAADSQVGEHKCIHDEVSLLRTQLADLEQEREIWGDEFSAVVMAKAERDEWIARYIDLKDSKVALVLAERDFLRSALESMTKERDEACAHLSHAECGDALHAVEQQRDNNLADCRALADDLHKAHAALLASQAQEARLRGALESIKWVTGYYDGEDICRADRTLIKAALSAPQGDK